MKKIIIVILLFLVLHQTQFAAVSIQTGNYHFKYTDIIVKSDEEPLRLDRVYNSRNKDVGWFGVGWSSDIETAIAPQKEQIALFLYGMSPPIMFTRDGEKSTDYYSPTGEKISRSALGYKLYEEAGTEKVFNISGKLIQVLYPSGYTLNFSYKDKKLRTISDNKLGQITLEWNSQNLIQSAKSSLGRESQYTYTGNQLIKSLDEEAQVYQYEYNARYDLTKIKSHDGKNTTLTYHKKTGNIESITDEKKVTTYYQYQYDPKAKNLNYTVEIKRGAQVQKFSFVTKERPTGDYYTQKVIVEIEGERAESLYGPECELPIQITDGKIINHFKYNANCLLTERTSSQGQKLQIIYDENINKMTKVIHNNLVTDYSYNKEKQMVEVKNSNGQKIHLSYDFLGRIKNMQASLPSFTKTLNLDLEYSGRDPRKFQIKTTGKKAISVNYNSKGEPMIKDTEDEAYKSQILQAFSTLNEMLTAHQMQI